MTVYLDTPNVGQAEKDYLAEAIDSSYVSTFGPFVPQFEREFASFLGQPYAVAVQSGTAALHMALVESRVGPGDEVIVPSLTFVASINPILYVGATPVFVDIDEKTWTLDLAMVEQAVTPKTRAMIPVHLYGNPCDMGSLINIARRHDLVVIEDATESFGAKIANQFTGSFGQWGCFSFNGNKIMTTGGGGMLIGSDVEQLHHVKFLVNQAREEAKGYYHSELGYNNRMTNIEAALGLAQLRRVKGFLEKKRRFYSIYREELSDIVSFQESYPEALSSYWFTAIRVSSMEVSVVQTALKEKGIPSRRNFMPAHWFPYLKNYAREALPVTDRLYEEGLCLPASTLNHEEDIRVVCHELQSILGTC